ncbi:MAG: hypothetical protein ACJATA_001480 [Sphingobacteriales bacterium]|jgi:hypothetical protein
MKLRNFQNKLLGLLPKAASNSFTIQREYSWDFYANVWRPTKLKTVFKFFDEAPHNFIRLFIYRRKLHRENKTS